MFESKLAILQFLQSAYAKVDYPFSLEKGILAEPKGLFGLRELSHLLSNPLLSPDWLKVIKDGREVDLSRDFLWKTVQGRNLRFLDKATLDGALRNGSSLVLEGLDILDPQISLLCADIDELLPSGLANCEAFFLRGGTKLTGGTGIVMMF